jgi:hypothetical protein
MGVKFITSGVKFLNRGQIYYIGGQIYYTGGQMYYIGVKFLNRGQIFKWGSNLLHRGSNFRNIFYNQKLSLFQFNKWLHNKRGCIYSGRPPSSVLTLTCGFRSIIWPSFYDISF